MNPQFPLYIVSKGRHESRLTVKTLEAMNVTYRIIVEPQEYNAYASVIDKAKILQLDMSFKDKYDTFEETDGIKATGSGPARNFAWEHSLSIGAKWHWVMDDNIRYFYRFNKNMKIPVSDGTMFRCAEDFVQRYENVVMAGPQYHFFAPRKSKLHPFILNTRIFSCNLIRNDIPFRWRGRYNEDVDLSIRILKAGYCTVLFNTFLQGKMNTLKMKGGNTDTIYQNGTMNKSSMIVKMHPDICELKYKFGRVHHHCDLTKFKDNSLVFKKNIEIKDTVNNYGMTLKKIK